MPTPVLASVRATSLDSITLINNLAIRDAGSHDATTDTPGINTFLADLRSMPGGKILYVNNTLNQAVTLSIETSDNSINVVKFATYNTIPANTSTYISTAVLPQLATPLFYLGVNATCTIAPTSGTLTVKVYCSNFSPASTTVSIIDSLFATYSAAFSGLTPVANATDIAGIYNSSVTTMKVTKLFLTFSMSPSRTIATYLIKRSTPNSTAGSSLITPVSYDSADTIIGGVARTWATNPVTPGALVGTIYSSLVFGDTTKNALDRLVLDYGVRPSSKAIILHNGEGIYWNLNGSSDSAKTTYYGTFEWTEN